jgi:hypothetical protein
VTFRAGSFRAENGFFLAIMDDDRPSAKTQGLLESFLQQRKLYRGGFASADDKVDRM